MNNIGLNLSSLNYYISKSKSRSKIIEEFSNVAIEKKIDGLEFYPSSFFKKNEKNEKMKIYKNLNTEGLFYILDCNKIFDISAIKDLIFQSKYTKKKIIVILLSKILECKRYLIKKDWVEYIEDSIKFLKKLEPIARDNNIKIAIENHQDFDSNDFLKILDNFSDDNIIGLNFDIGNAFAVCEDPMIFCKKIAHKINNVHIKDYKITETKEGFLLSNCSIGKGSVNLKPILNYIDNVKPNITKMIEPGQLTPRHIKKNKKFFWTKIGKRLIDEHRQFERVLKQSMIKNKKNFDPIIGKKDKEIFHFLKNQINQSINYCKKLS